MNIKSNEKEVVKCNLSKNNKKYKIKKKRFNK